MDNFNIKSLRAASKQDQAAIVESIKKAATGGEKKSYADDRFWKLEPDKAGNATATIRFLPTTVGGELPWAKVFKHGFQGPSGIWYINDCATTLGKPCPVCEMNSKLYNSVDSDDTPERKQVRQQKRKLQYVVNILVVNDPKHPENNGQVRLFWIGKKIFDMIQNKANPTFEDETPMNVFDYWNGANFKIRQKKVEGYPNYDSSVWEDPSAIGEDDEILRVAKAQFLLTEFVQESRFKTYDEAAEMLNKALHGVGAGTTAARMAEDADADSRPSMDAPRMPEKPAFTPASKPAAAPKAKQAWDDDDDSMNYFQSLAQEE